jgi:hypothetical protein
MDLILGLGIALPIASSVGVSVTTGVAQGVKEQKKQNADASNQTRMLKFHLDVIVGDKARYKRGAHLNNFVVTLHDDKLWLEAKDLTTGLPLDSHHHPFTGFYIAYPDDARGHTRGLVSTISVDPPMLNWIYVDKHSGEVRYANRSGSIEHHVGDFDWTTDSNEDSRVTLDGWEGFLAVEESEEQWSLYFDWDDDGLRGKRRGRTVVEVQLQRKVITNQEVNMWGLEEEGNIGFRATREV